MELCSWISKQTNKQTNTLLSPDTIQRMWSFSWLANKQLLLIFREKKILQFTKDVCIRPWLNLPIFEVINCENAGNPACINQNEITYQSAGSLISINFIVYMVDSSPVVWLKKIKSRRLTLYLPPLQLS
jgi:hypothetical protein